MVELIIVLAILATITAVVAPGALRRPEPKLPVIVADLAARLERLHIEAVATGRPLAVTLDERIGALDVLVGAARIALPPGTTANLRGVRSTAGGASIVFFADGSATGGRLTLMRGGDRRSIAVNWLTGAVKVEAAR